MEVVVCVFERVDDVVKQLRLPRKMCMCDYQRTPDIFF